MNTTKPSTSGKPKPVAILEVAEQGRHFMKLEFAARHLWLPLPYLTQPREFCRFMADRVGIADPEMLKKLRHQWAGEAKKLPRIVGMTRQGWLPDRSAFVFGRQVLTASDKTSGYEFVAPSGTELHDAAETFTPRGSREAHYSGVRDLWNRELTHRLVLCLAAVSPFLEPLGLPPLGLHLAGPSGLGKTTVMRAGVAIHGRPTGLVYLDISKDTRNYVDARLGILHNFPALVDETTLRDVQAMAELAYSIGVGRTKGRLSDGLRDYTPVAPRDFTLVTFFSGETTIRDKMLRQGGAARFMELAQEEPLFPRHELPRWYNFASDHSGWIGRDLILGQLVSDPTGAALHRLYNDARATIGVLCDDHSRFADFLSAVYVGYRLIAALGWESADGHGDALVFTRQVYERLSKATGADTTLEALAVRLATEPNGADLVKKGWLPVKLVSTAVKDQLTSFGIVQPGPSTPRRVNGASVKCLILTPTGRAQFEALIPPAAPQIAGAKEWDGNMPVDHGEVGAVESDAAG